MIQFGSVDPNTFTIVEIEDLATAVKGVGTSKVAVLQDVRSESINGGANETITAGAWHQRKLNSKYDDQLFVKFENFKFESSNITYVAPENYEIIEND